MLPCICALLRPAPQAGGCALHGRWKHPAPLRCRRLPGSATVVGPSSPSPRPRCGLKPSSASQPSPPRWGVLGLLGMGGDGSTGGRSALQGRQQGGRGACMSAQVSTAASPLCRSLIRCMASGWTSLSKSCNRYRRQSPAFSVRTSCSALALTLALWQRSVPLSACKGEWNTLLEDAKASTLPPRPSHAL